MKSKNESIILLIIRYAPPLTIIALAIIISFSFYLNKQKIYEEEKIEIEKEFIVNNKQLIKSQVNRVQNYILKQQVNTEIELKKNLKKRVYKAYNIAMNLYNENKHLNEKTLKKLIADAIRPIRFNKNRGYFFIYTMKGINILNAAFPKIEGKDFWNYQDAKNVYLIQKMNEILKTKNETYYDWYWNKPKNGEKRQFKKIGFFKKIEPLNLFIGTGEYIKDFEDDIKKKVLKHISGLTYQNKGYIFILSHDGVYLNHYRKEIIGLNALEAKDTKEHQSILNAIEMSKKPEGGYLSYIQNRKPGSDLPIKKISYIKGVKNWNWVIGKGFYEDDINKMLNKKKNILENRFKSNLNSLFIIASVLTIILLAISIYISKLLEKRFNVYQEEIQLHLKNLTKQHNILAQQSKMAAIGEMIANIAHQWRQPLSMISAAATGLKLKKEIGALSNEELDKSIDYINNSTQYLSKTIDDFRYFFVNNQEQKNFFIQDVFDETLNIIGAQLKNKNIKIVKNICNSEIYGIKNELIQVFINILNNSRDELIKNNKTENFIFIDAIEKSNKLILKIKDNAGGIKKENIQHVFEPYFTTKHQSQGTGIGLYMSQEIIVKHFKGEIQIDNTEFEYNNKTFTGAQTTITLNMQSNR